MVKMGVFAMIRWVIPIFPDAVLRFDNVVILLSIVGMLYACCIAWMQDDLKRMLGFNVYMENRVQKCLVLTAEKNAQLMADQSSTSKSFVE